MPEPTEHQVNEHSPLSVGAIQEGTLLWEPSEAFREASVMAEFLRFVNARLGTSMSTYQELWQWSIDDLEAFWTAEVEFFGLKFSSPYERVLAERAMPAARWFPGATLNYAEQVFSRASTEFPALVAQSETKPLREISWAELETRVASVAARLREAGVVRGDRVVAFMPNIPEAVVAFLAVASLGAIWSSCSPDFGVGAVLDRFKQIEPKVLFAVDGYSYGGKLFDRQAQIAEIRQGLPTLELTVLVPYMALADEATLPEGAVLWDQVAGRVGETLRYEQVPFEHPLWVLYSSGTTGLPKALVHSQGGIVVEHLKVLGIHTNLRAGDRFFWFTSTGWMMWNYIVGGLLVGATPVLYDGSPAYPDMKVVWELAQNARINVLGTSAAFITACLKERLNPGAELDLSALESVGSTGSPLPAEGFAWVYSNVKRDLWLTSVSGGTDVCSSFFAGCALLPVHAGELQARALGARVESFDEQGQPLVGETGELVVTAPMPSMPVFLWNDADGSRYLSSYFEEYPGVWRHGDWVKITPRGSAVIQGRSDSTLNRQGVRIGTSEIYSAVESLPEVVDSLVIGLELPGGGYYLPLFVKLADGVELDDALVARIKQTVRSTFSPRHVPDAIFAVPAIPRTLTDKRMEVPVKKLFQGIPLAKAANAGATKQAGVLEAFVELAREISPLLKGRT